MYKFQPRSICKYNLMGMCRFGTRCWHIHEEPDRNVQQPNRNVQRPNRNLQEPNRSMQQTDRNVQQPDRNVQETESNATTHEEESAQGACALSPSKPKEKKSNCFQNNYGPSTSTVEEAISLVKISESEEKTCGICMDNILKRDNRADQTFGILPNCNHCYCFTCLRKWRKTKDCESSKSCPECRIVSDFVFPSKTWMTSKEEKDTFIDNQRRKMKQKDCGYFRKGKGKCPFGNTCLYLHALPNGKVLDVGPPRPRRSPALAAALESEADMLQQILFWINDDDIESDDDFDDCILDLDDPCIAMQYYDRGDIRRYIAMNRLMNGSDDDDDDIDMIF